MSWWVWPAIVVVVALVVAAIAIVVWRNRRTKRLREAFGPEYDRVVQIKGGRTHGEAELERRLRGRADADVWPLDTETRERYLQLWTQAQSSFVDSPSGAIGQADGIVTDLMRQRGYPNQGFSRRSEDLSVDHPDLVERYRFGRRVADANDRGDATTEDLRRAMEDFGVLIEALLGMHEPVTASPANPQSPSSVQAALPRAEERAST